ISDAKKGVERRPFAITATGNVLTVVAKHAGTVQTPFLCCSVQTPMRRISDDVFAIKLALAKLNEAMLTFYSPWEEESDAGASVFPFAWRGSTAPAAPMEASSLTGEIVFVEFWSDSLDETRK